MTKVAVFAAIAMGAGCSGGEPVTELGQVFGDRPSAVVGPEAGTSPIGGDGGVTESVPRAACALSDAAKNGLLAYFPLDSDANSHAGRVIATLREGYSPKFAPGKIGRGLAGGQEMWVEPSQAVPLARYTLCAWVAPSSNDDVARAFDVDTGAAFSYPTATLRKNDFNLVCWISGGGATEMVVVDGGRERNVRAASPHDSTTIFRIGDPTGETIVDEVALFGAPLDATDVSALWAGGRGCLLEGLR